MLRRKTTDPESLEEMLAQLTGEKKKGKKGKLDADDDSDFEDAVVAAKKPVVEGAPAYAGWLWKLLAVVWAITAAALAAAVVALVASLMHAEGCAHFEVPSPRLNVLLSGRGFRRGLVRPVTRLACPPTHPPSTACSRRLADKASALSGELKAVKLLRVMARTAPPRPSLRQRGATRPRNSDPRARCQNVRTHASVAADRSLEPRHRATAPLQDRAKYQSERVEITEEDDDSDNLVSEGEKRALVCLLWALALGVARFEADVLSAARCAGRRALFAPDRRHGPTPSPPRVSQTCARCSVRTSRASRSDTTVRTRRSPSPTHTHTHSSPLRRTSGNGAPLCVLHPRKEYLPPPPRTL